MNKDQPKGPFCQSCAMQICFEKGKFTDPMITKEQMIKKVAGMMKQMNMADSQIEQVKTFIPMLKRWR